MKARIQHVLKTYGKTAAVFHGSVFAATLSGCSAAIHYGVDLKPALQHIPFVDLSDMDPKAGTLALAYLSTLATGAFVLVHTAAAVDVRRQTDRQQSSFVHVRCFPIAGPARGALTIAAVPAIARLLTRVRPMRK